MTSYQANLFVDGEWRPATSGQTSASLNPANQQQLGTFAAGDASDAKSAIAAARRAFERAD